eukprot:g33769.t1
MSVAFISRLRVCGLFIFDFRRRPIRTGLLGAPERSELRPEAYATAQHRDLPLFEALTSECAPRRCQGRGGQELPITLWALAVSGYPSDSVFQAASQQAADCVGAMDVSHICNIVWAVARRPDLPRSVAFEQIFNQMAPDAEPCLWPGDRHALYDLLGLGPPARLGPCSDGALSLGLWPRLVEKVTQTWLQLSYRWRPGFLGQGWKVHFGASSIVPGWTENSLGGLEMHSVVDCTTVEKDDSEAKLEMCCKYGEISVAKLEMCCKYGKIGCHQLTDKKGEVEEKEVKAEEPEESAEEPETAEKEVKVEEPEKESAEEPETAEKEVKAEEPEKESAKEPETAQKEVKAEEPEKESVPEPEAEMN